MGFKDKTYGLNLLVVFNCNLDALETLIVFSWNLDGLKFFFFFNSYNLNCNYKKIFPHVLHLFFIMKVIQLN
jgi:hypothetical protein